MKPEQFNPAQFYEKLAKDYPEEIINNMTPNWIELNKFVHKHLDSVKGSLMDFGCGQGRNSLYYQHGNVWGIDIAPTNIRIATIRSKLIAHKYKRTFEVADVTSPLKYCGFDNLICIEVIEHLPEHGHFFKNIFSILAEGGVALITTPQPPKNPWTVSEVIAEFGIKDGLYYHSGYTPQYLSGKLSEAGLVIIESGVLPNNHSFVKAKRMAKK